MDIKAILRLCFAVVLSMVLGYSGASAQQRSFDVDLVMRDATVKSFTDALSKQTGAAFSFGKDLADKSLGNIEVHAKHASLEKILSDVLVPKGYQFLIAGNSVAISVAPTPVSVLQEIHGFVRDPHGDPIPGAGVFVSGTDDGTVTNLDGAFGIRAPKGASLQFSCVGYQTATAVVGNSHVLNVVLEIDSRVLDEVVVVGYGTQARKTLSASVSKVDGDKLMDAPVSSVGDALKGKVPGMRIATSNALSGEAPRFLIRGGSSVNLSNNPVFIVDGALRDDLNGVNPNDIESMEVLKDAASAAIYGARASNGVILVTTKKGSVSQGPEIVFDVQMGVQSPATKWDILNSREFLSYIRPGIATTLGNNNIHPASSMLNGATAFGTGNTYDTSIFSVRYLDWGGTVPDGYQWMMDPLDETKVLIFTDTDWQSQWFRSDAFWQKEYIGVNGGNDVMKYAASVSYMQDDGVVATSDYNVLTMHSNTIFKVSKNLEAGATFDLSRQSKSMPYDNYYQPIGRGVIAPTTSLEKNALGEWNQLIVTNVHSHSPAWYSRFFDHTFQTNRISGTFNLDWYILDGLKAHAQYNYYNQHTINSYYVYAERDGSLNGISTARNTKENRASTTRDTFTAFLAYDKTFADAHHLAATAGYEYMRQEYVTLNASATGAASDDVPYLQSATNFAASNLDQSQCLISYFGRLGYDFKHRYIISGTFRADGSSKFALGNRWGFFPSASAAWVISEEPFWNQDATKINHLKFRASYGQTGNNSIGLYDTYGAFVTGQYAGLSTFSPSAMQNASMRWETTTQLDLGMDVGFFRDRIRILLDYYDKTTDNMLFAITLPDTSPYSSVKANVGSARFYGAEVELHTENVRTRNFSWSTDLTYAYNANRVLSLPEEYGYDEVDPYGNPTGKRAYRIGGYTMSESGYRFGGTAVGEPLGRIYGYKADHIIDGLPEADGQYYDVNSLGYRVGDGSYATGRHDAGDWAWMNRLGSAKDADGNEIINAEDVFYLGNVMPHSVGGINNTFRFKRFTLGVYLDYAIGHSIVNGQKTQMLKSGMGDSNQILGRMVYDCWEYPGDPTAKYARWTPNDSDWSNRNWRGTSSFMTERADYLCLRDVTLSYDLSERLLKPFKIKKATIGVMGNTLYYLTGVTGAVSPESGMGSSSSASMYKAISTNNSSSDDTGNLMPPARKIIFSVKVVF